MALAVYVTVTTMLVAVDGTLNGMKEKIANVSDRSI